jgi:hypothetical protein
MLRAAGPKPGLKKLAKQRAGVQGTLIVTHEHIGPLILMAEASPPPMASARGAARQEAMARGEW